MKLNKILIIFLLVFNVKIVFALKIEPDFIKIGETLKETEYTFNIKVFNNSNEPIEILGVINQCGLNFNLERKYLSPLKAIYGDLRFNSGTNPGRFIESVKIVYKEKDTIKQKTLTVSWFNKVEFYSKLFILDKKIDLGEIKQNRSKKFFIEVVNAGNSEGEILFHALDEGLTTNVREKIPPKSNKFLELKLDAKTEVIKKRLSYEKLDVRGGSGFVEIFGRPSQIYSISIDNPVKKDQTYELSLIINNVNSLGQLLEVRDVHGNKYAFDRSAIFRGDNIIKVFVPEKNIDIVVKNGISLTVKFLLNDE